MTRKPRRGAKPSFADPSEIETDEKITDAVERLDQLGKSPADIIALVERVEAEGFDLSETQWSADQFLTALELMCLYAFRTVQSGDVRHEPVTLAAIALLYGSAIKQQADLMIDHMLPDWNRGRKAREKASQNYGSTPAKRAIRRERLQKINLDVCLDFIKRKGPGSLDTLTKIRQYQLIAEQYQKRHGAILEPRTIDRELHYLRELKKKLDKRGLSR